METRKKVSRMPAPTFAENSLWDVWAFSFVNLHSTLQPVDGNYRGFRCYQLTGTVMNNLNHKVPWLCPQMHFLPRPTVSTWLDSRDSLALKASLMLVTYKYRGSRGSRCSLNTHDDKRKTGNASQLISSRLISSHWCGYLSSCVKDSIVQPGLTWVAWFGRAATGGCSTVLSARKSRRCWQTADEEKCIK